MIKAYTDASFDEKRGVAGIGIVVKKGEQERVFSNWINVRTVNEAELFAIHLAGILTEGGGIIYTDSQTALAYIKGEIKGKQRTKEQFMNHKHCLFWAKQIKQRNLHVEKIKAHQNKMQIHVIGNRMADLLAMAGRGKFYEKIGH